MTDEKDLDLQMSMEDFIDELTEMEQPEAPACGLNGEECEGCGS